MALLIRQDESRSEMQKKLASELQEKIKNKSIMTDKPDGVDDSQYIEGLEKTTSLAWVWVLIIIFAVGILIWLVGLSMAN